MARQLWLFKKPPTGIIACRICGKVCDFKYGLARHVLSSHWVTISEYRRRFKNG